MTVATEHVPSWPAATSPVPGHRHCLAAGTLAGRSVVALSGRVHVYEGHSPAAVAFPVRTLALLGMETLILTNAAGGIRDDLQPGALMVIDDHLNFMGGQPLRGSHDPRFGPRFPDMTEAYGPSLRETAHTAAGEHELDLTSGVYAAVSGPAFETPAEIRALRAAGADAVGMSTVPETIVARQLGLDVLGVSCIANRAAGLGDAAATHEDVLAVTAEAAGRLGRLLTAVVARL